MCVSPHGGQGPNLSQCTGPPSLFTHNRLDSLLTAKPQSCTNHLVKVCVYGVWGTTGLLEAWELILNLLQERHDSECLLLPN